MSQIKIKRALARAAVGRYPASADAMLQHVPPAVIAALSSAALADVLDALWTACRQSKAIAARDVLAEGTVWDADQHRLREVS